MKIEFPHCTVEWEPDHRRAVTRFADGSEAYARPHETPEYLAHAVAKSTGDVDLYCFQHDIAHVIVGLMNGGPSVVLWNLAHGLSDKTPECDAEEQAAQEFQLRFFLR
jgi:hypothetical protein